MLYPSRRHINNRNQEIHFNQQDGFKSSFVFELMLKFASTVITSFCFSYQAGGARAKRCLVKGWWTVFIHDYIKIQHNQTKQVRYSLPMRYCHGGVTVVFIYYIQQQSTSVFLGFISTASLLHCI